MLDETVAACMFCPEIWVQKWKLFFGGNAVIEAQ